MRTLLVEPDPDRQQKLWGVLVQRGHQVTCADGQGALQAVCQDGTPQLILVGVDRLALATDDLLGQLRRASGRNCLLVALTERDDPDHLARLLRAGADGYLLFSPDRRLLEVRLAMLERWADAAARAEPVQELLAGRQACGAEPALETNQQLQAIFDRAVEGILVADMQTRKLHLGNPKMCRMLGYSREEISKLSVADIHPAEALPEVMEQFNQQAKGQLAQSRNIPVRRKDGTVLYADISSFRMTLGGREYLAGIFRDVTERRWTEEALRESEARYRLIAENATDMIWTARIQGINEAVKHTELAEASLAAEELMRRWQFTYISPAVERLLGYAVDEAMGLKLEELLSSRSYQKAAGLLAEELLVERQRSADPRRQRAVELEHITKQRSTKWCEVTMTFLRDQQGAITGILGATRDITQRRQAEAALRQSESMLRTLVENMPDVVALLDRQGNLRYLNRTTSGVPVSQVLGRDAFQFAAARHRQLCRRTFQEVLRSGRPQPLNVLDVFGRWWNCRMLPLTRDGEVQDVMAIITEITEKKKAEAAIRKQQELLRQLLELHERDRELLAFELHDGFIQLLAGAMMNFQAAVGLEQSLSEHGRKSFQEGIRLLRESIDEARRLISGLRPPVLEQFGILAAVEHLVAESQNQGGQQIELVSKGHFQRLARPLESAIFRIVQESLTNARRHSQSDKVRVELACEKDQVTITVEDWGVGFQPEKVDEACFGIKGIEQRARLLGGHAQIRTSPGKGTRVMVRLPLVQRHPDGHEQL